MVLTRLLKAKIHNATVTETQVDYHGSIRVDADLLKASGILPNEAVLVVDCDNGNRFETYVIFGDHGSGVIGVYGAAALLTEPGHRVIIMSFVQADEAGLSGHRSRVVLTDAKNRATDVITHPTRLEA